MSRLICILRCGGRDGLLRGERQEVVFGVLLGGQQLEGEVLPHFRRIGGEDLCGLGSGRSHIASVIEDCWWIRLAPLSLLLLPMCLPREGLLPSVERVLSNFGGSISCFQVHKN